MRLLQITIKEYKNLKNFDCVFQDSNISAFIGNNGSGKSNLLEAVTEVFSYAKNYSNSKIVEAPNLLGCKIKYENNEATYLLEYDKPKFSISFNGKKLNKSEMSAALPETIMLYYAGETNRQQVNAKRTFDESYDNKLKNIKNEDFQGFKYLDSYSVHDLPLLLITAVVYKGKYYKKLLNLLKCDSIVSQVSLMLKNPKEKGGAADIYWGARGFVKSFLDSVRKYVSSTDDLSNRYLMKFKDITAIKDLSNSECELFAKLKALDNAGYIYETSVSLKNNKTEFSWDELSEGEKQLSLLLLLASFTAKKDVLYLFDEFDAYLHLNWQRKFARMLNELCIKGHIVFSTHSPATVSGMQRKNVFIMSDGKAELAASETYNRSLDEIMEEHMSVSMRPAEFVDLEQEFRKAIINGEKSLAEEVLDKIKMIVGENDPFFITARIVLNRMENK